MATLLLSLFTCLFMLMSLAEVRRRDEVAFMVERRRPRGVVIGGGTLLRRPKAAAVDADFDSDSDLGGGGGNGKGAVLAGVGVHLDAWEWRPRAKDKNRDKSR